MQKSLVHKQALALYWICAHIGRKRFGRKWNKLISHKAEKLSGKPQFPVIKSISHRALILAPGHRPLEIHGLLESEDVIHTAKALGLMGADHKNDKVWQVSGVSTGGLSEPEDILYIWAIPALAPG